jgi:FtsH-binding integral membrane protein
VDRAVPSPRRVGATAFVATSLLALVPENWLGVGLAVALLGAMAAVTARWSRRKAWAAAHRFALAAGATLTYAWLGFVVLPYNDAATTLNVTGQVVLALAAVALLTAVSRTLGGSRA